MVFGQFYIQANRFDAEKHAFTDETFLTECLGSDGVYILDGRNKLETQIQDMRRRAGQLKGVMPYLAAFRICKGTIGDCVFLTDLIKL